MRSILKFFSIIVIVVAVGFLMVACDTKDEDITPPQQNLPIVNSSVAVPTGISAAAESSSSIIITWEAASGANGYKIFRGLGSETRDQIGSTSSTSYIDTELSPNTRYYYRITAYNNQNESRRSDFTSAVTLSAILPPENFLAQADSSNSLTISWDAVHNATGYEIQRNIIDSRFGFTDLDSLSDTSYTDTGLSSSTTYYYRIRSYNDEYESSWSDIISETTLEGIPAIPSSVRATPIISYINVTWASVNGTSRYHIYRSESSNGNYIYIGYIGALSSRLFYADNDVLPNITYYYKVSAVNSHGESELSNWSSGRTTAAANVGKTKEDAIEFPSPNLSSSSINGGFPAGYDEVWYKFTISSSSRTLYALDRFYSSSYSGDIVVDLYYGSSLLPLEIGGRQLTNVNIGGGDSDRNNITASNWFDGTYYVRVRPSLSSASNKGTFQLVLKRN